MNPKVFTNIEIMELHLVSIHGVFPYTRIATAKKSIRARRVIGSRVPILRKITSHPAQRRLYNAA